MRKFVALNCLVDHNDSRVFRSDAIQNLRQALLAPALYKPGILQALVGANFKFHRTCSLANIIEVCLCFFSSCLPKAYNQWWE